MIETLQQIIISDSRKLSNIDDETIDLVVTSPPYPMIAMWDELFCSMSIDVRKALNEENGNRAFEAMHLEMDKVWIELYRVMRKGSFACINIGDATRTIGGNFQLFSNHARIIKAFKKIGFNTLPVILWRKQTNAPNKFMGSGMLPSGAYVTLEHEYILIFRKGNKKEYRSTDLKVKRMESAFFWEERNCWFSDIWDFKGTSQSLNHKDLRNRSAAYPFDLAYRLINMYSLIGDTVLDPFCGTGTTIYASLACGRTGIGVEIDSSFLPVIFNKVNLLKDFANKKLDERINSHNIFINGYTKRKGAAKYLNIPHGFPVVTKQETGIQLQKIDNIDKINSGALKVSYAPIDISRHDR